MAMFTACNAIKQAGIIRPVVLLCFLLALTACQSTPQYKEVVQIQFGLLPFKQAFKKDNADGTGKLTLYIPNQENLDEWRQMVSVQTLPNYRKSLSLTMHRLQEDLNARCGGVNVDWNVLQHNSATIVYETRVTNCGQAPDQYEMTRLFHGNNTLHRVSYVSKDLKKTKAERQQWYRVISSAFVDIAREN